MNEEPAVFEITEHEYAGRELFARKTSCASTRWRVVREPEPECWYDFADPETGEYGQCKMSENGKWAQAPKGKNPVLLQWILPGSELER